MNYFVYNNKPSSDFGCEVSDVSSWNSSFPAFDTAQVPGVLGDLVHYKDTYTNINITYRCMWKDGNFEEGYDQLRRHLLAEPGYHKLWDSYHHIFFSDGYTSSQYRHAVIASQLQPQRLGYPMKNGVVDVTFYCKPQRYMCENYGMDFQHSFNSPNSVTVVSLLNKTPNPSSPYIYFEDGYIHLYGEGVGSYLTYDVREAPSTPVVLQNGFIDCELGVVRNVKEVDIWTPSGIIRNVKYPDSIHTESSKKIVWGSTGLVHFYGLNGSERVRVGVQGKGFIRPRWWVI